MGELEDETWEVFFFIIITDFIERYTFLCSPVFLSPPLQPSELGDVLHCLPVMGKCGKKETHLTS